MAWGLVDLTGSYELSANGHVYVGNVELLGFKTGTLTISGSTVDNTTRDDGGWSKNAPGLRSATLSLTYNKYPDDTSSPAVTTSQMGIAAHIIANQTTWSNKGVPITYLDGDGGSTPVYQGFAGTWVLTSYGETQTCTGDGGGTAIEVSVEFSNFGPITSATTPPVASAVVEEEKKEEEEE